MDMALTWDTNVSRLHAELERRGETWLLVDEGMSTNGTRVNGDLVSIRRRLSHGDVITVGVTPIQFYAPGEAEDAGTSRLQDSLEVHVTPAQQRVLEALCDPLLDSPQRRVSPPTNKEIGAAIYLSERAVKSHLRALFQAFGIDDLPQNAKRTRLVDLAIQHGLVGSRRGPGR